MPYPGGFDLEGFQAKVQKRLELVQKSGGGIQNFYEPPHFGRSAKSTTERAGCSGLVGSLLVSFMESMSVTAARGLKAQREKLTVQAEAVAQQREVKLRICPALQGVGNDPCEVAKVITPILIPLISSGAIAMSLDSDLFAMLALVIVRMGTPNYCAG